MAPIYIQEPPVASTSSLNLPAGTLILVSPVALPKMNSWADLIAWLQSNPEFIAMLITMILTFLGAAAANQKTPENPTPPKG